MNSQLKNRLAHLKKKNFGKHHKAAYLKELRQLVLPKVNDCKIWSLENTLKIPKRDMTTVKRICFSFHEKEKLKVSIENLITKKNGRVLLITAYALYCGALELESLSDFNIYFSFEAEHQGLIQLKSVDTADELVLDFYEEAGEKKIDIEIVGKNWLKASIIDEFYDS